MNHEISSRELTSAEASRLKRSEGLGIKGWAADDLLFFILVTGGLIVVGIALLRPRPHRRPRSLDSSASSRILAISMLMVFALKCARVGVAFMRQSRGDLFTG